MSSLCAPEFHLLSLCTKSTVASPADRKGALPIQTECSAHSAGGSPATTTTSRSAAVFRDCIETDQRTPTVPSAASGAWGGRTKYEDKSLL